MRQGRGPRDYDCWGLVVGALKMAGHTVPFDPVEASESPLAVKALFAQHLRKDEWVASEAVDGAVVFFPSFSQAIHAGVMIEGRLLQTRRQFGATWQPLSAFPYSRMEFARWGK
ncbi:MAG: NlpC/P60 family protein [Henriciella sp.]|nr:NlpC/P60 family protein [Henriciella sp.]